RRSISPTTMKWSRADVESPGAWGHGNEWGEALGLKLHGFNNLTRTLSFNIYAVRYAGSARRKREYIDYFDEVYNARRLTDILGEVTDLIDAQVLNIACQDYEPEGASAAMLIAEEPMEV